MAGRFFTAEPPAKPIYVYAAAAAAAAAAAKSLQSCPTLCDPRDGSPSGSARQEHWSGLPLPSLKNYKKIKKKERTYSN